MTKNAMITLATLVFLAAACKQDPPPLPMQAPPPQQVQAPAIPAPQLEPAEPIVVFASAEPAHGGVTQRIGDYMVELATGGEGKVHFHVQRFEGATQAFDAVQLEVAARPAGSDTVDQTVVFYPKEGKLEGTVAGMTKTTYDFGVALYEIGTNNVAVGSFDNVEVDPLPTDLEAEHDGTVKLIDRTKMEVVAEGNKLLLYLRDLQGNSIPPSAAKVDDVDIEVGDGETEKVPLQPVGDHYEGEISGDLPEDSPIRIINARLVLGGETYDNLRIPGLNRKLRQAHKKSPGATPPSMTRTEAQKTTPGAEMRGTIGQMKVGASPAQAKPIPPAAEDASSKTKSSKGPMTKAKKGQ